MDNNDAQDKEKLKEVKVISHVVKASINPNKRGKGLGNDGGYTWVG